MFFFIYWKKFGKKLRKPLSWKFTDELSVKYLWICKWGRWIRPKSENFDNKIPTELKWDILMYTRSEFALKINESNFDLVSWGAYLWIFYFSTSIFLRGLLPAPSWQFRDYEIFYLLKPKVWQGRDYSFCKWSRKQNQSWVFGITTTFI